MCGAISFELWENLTDGGPLSQGQSEWVVWVLCGLLHLNLHIVSSQQTVIAKSVKEPLKMSDFTPLWVRVQDKAKTDLKEENLSPPP